jgi:hypothetical protein
MTELHTLQNTDGEMFICEETGVIYYTSAGIMQMREQLEALRVVVDVIAPLIAKWNGKPECLLVGSIELEPIKAALQRAREIGALKDGG